MWGTDWTRTIGMLTYEQGVTPFRDTKRLSENDKAALMGGRRNKVYKLGARPYRFGRATI